MHAARTARSLLVGSVALIGPIAYASPAAARSAPVAAGYTEISAGRATALVAAGLSVLGLVVAGYATARARHHARLGGVATVGGIAGIVLGTVVIITADGGLGTGNGLGGGIVAAAVGGVATALGVRLLRQVGSTDSE